MRHFSLNATGSIRRHSPLSPPHWRVAHGSQHTASERLARSNRHRRHLPHTHTVSTCPQASHAGAIVQEPETYANSENARPSKAAGKVRNQTKLPFVRNNP